MRRVNLLSIAGAITLLATPVLAADLPMMPPPPLPVAVESSGGWYLRGDIGMSNQHVKRLDNALQNTAGTTTTFPVLEFDSAPIFGVGVGYQFNGWLRADLTGEYRGKSSFNGSENVYSSGVFANVDNYTAKKSEWLFLANAYADLGTWYSITPFVGAGLGTSRVTISGFTDTCPVGCGGGSVAYGATQSKWNFAWAVHAGLAYQVNRNLTLELAYRYVDLGKGVTGDLVTASGVNSIYNPTTFRDITSHDLKLGVRWMLDAPEPAPTYLPPLVRKG